MSSKFWALFSRALDLTGIGEFPRPTRSRQRRFRRHAIFTAQFIDGDSPYTTAPTCRADLTVECLEVRLMMTASSEADFVFADGSITGYTGTGGHVVIPSTIGGRAVTSIGFGAFQEATALVSVTLPAGLKRIDMQAFFGCTNLTSITFPAGLESIGPTAFMNCRSLTSVTLPDGLRDIGSSVFVSCTSLAHVSLPDGLTNLAGNAFGNCTALTSISLPATLTNIGVYAFSGCTRLASISLPAGLTTVARGTFARCLSLETVDLPASLTSIEASAFGECGNLTSIALPSGLTTIGEYAFASCVSLRNVVLPESLTQIGESAFSHCTNLMAVSWPSSVTAVSSEIFTNCLSLTTVVLPTGLTSIGTGAFSGCSNLQSITLPNSLTSIGAAAFSGCTRLSKVALPAGLAALGDFAFEQCRGLTDVELPAGLTAIGQHTFLGCTSLKTVSIPATVTRIADYAFAFCPSLTAVMFSGDKPSLAPLVFFDSNQVTVYYLPATTGWSSTVVGRPASEAIAPTAPSAVRIVAGHRQLDVSWNQPQFNGGGPISDYVIQYRPSTNGTWLTFDDGISPLPSVTVTGLDDKLRYVVRVAAVNAIGVSGFSQNSVAAIPRTSPTEPIGLIATADKGRVTLRWARPASDGGSPITDYVIQYLAGNGTQWRTVNDGRSTATATTVRGLRNGIAYTFRVWARNNLGRSTLPAASATATPRTVPGITRSVRGSVLDGSVELSWAPPASSGGAEIVDYLVQYSINNGRTWIAFDDGVSDSRSAVISALNTGRRYVFRVAARNAAGTGAFSAKSVAIRL